VHIEILSYKSSQGGKTKGAVPFYEGEGESLHRGGGQQEEGRRTAVSTWLKAASASLALGGR
jgi:hypothetical protein